jgi:hypothetical protein
MAQSGEKGKLKGGENKIWDERILFDRRTGHYYSLDLVTQNGRKFRLM